MIESGNAIIVAPSLRRRGLIRSGSQALFIFRFRRTFLTSSTVITIDVREYSVGGIEVMADCYHQCPFEKQSTCSTCQLFV